MGGGGGRKGERDYCLLTSLVGVYVDREGREGGDWGGSKEGERGGKMRVSHTVGSSFLFSPQ